jgi:hypothetical protein
MTLSATGLVQHRVVFILCGIVLYGTVPKTCFGSVHKYHTFKLDKVSREQICVHYCKKC